jgi:hypothetical protein
VSEVPEVSAVSAEHGVAEIGYGTEMNYEDSTEEIAGSSQSSSIDAIRDRISTIQENELDQHVAEYDAIHAQLERALTSIDGL